MMNFKKLLGEHQISWAFFTATTLLLNLSGAIAIEPIVSPNQPPETPEITEPAQSPSPTNLQPAVLLLHSFTASATAVETLIFSSDGQTLVSGGDTNEPLLKFWSVSDGKQTKSIRGQASAIEALAITPDGTTLVSSGEDAGINFWEWATKSKKNTFLGHYSQVLSLAITPDGKILISGGLDGIRVWTLNPRHLLYQLTNFGSPSYTLAIHPNGYILATGDEQGKVKFWDLKYGTLVSEFRPHEELISGLAITPDGQTLITASYDRTIKIWNLPTGELLFTLENHTSGIRAIALSSNGQLLASASNDGVRLWNVQRGTMLQRLTKHNDWVDSVAFSPDGRFLASGGVDGTVNIWEIPLAYGETPTRVEMLFNETNIP